MSKRVVVGLSGGVDSSVAALLLKQQGYEVIGLFMRNWEETDDSNQCTTEQDFLDVKGVADAIGISYYTINFSKEYWDNVFEEFLTEIKKGRTPNPDVLCNREIKFGPFLDYAKKIGADYIATGHYAKVECKDKKYYLCNSFDTNKDQTYFLNQLNQKQLSKVLFPLADIDKKTVRQIAEKYNIPTAHKKDSTGICFIGERNFRDFLKTYIPSKKGKIKLLNGQIVGEHDGVMYYTLGQRRGLNIGGRKDGNGNRWFVIDKDIKNNILYVSQGEDDNLYSNGLITYKVNWIPEKPKDNLFECEAKFRYRQPNQKVMVEIKEDKIIVKFAEPQRAVTTGQYVVFYKDKCCLGGGVIEETFKND